MRSHFYRPIVDLTGGLYEYAQVRVLAEDGGFLGQTIWRNEDDLVALANPFACIPAIVEFYLDEPQRVLLEVTVPGSGPMDLEAVDVGPPSIDVVRSAGPIFIRNPPAVERTLRARDTERLEWGHFVANHDHADVGIALNTDYGAASGSRTVLVGYDAGNSGGGSGPVVDAVGIGSNAGIWHDGSVAVGRMSEAAAGDGTGGTALGYSMVSYLDAVAIGDDSRAWGSKDVSLGHLARSTWSSQRQVVVGSGTDADSEGGVGDEAVLIKGAGDTARAVAIGSGSRAVLPGLGGAHVMLGSGPLDAPDLPVPSPPSSDSVVSWRANQEPSIPGVLNVLGEAVLGAASGLVSHFGATPTGKPTVTGSEELNVALGYLMTALEDMGLVVRGTTDAYIPPKPLTAQGTIIDRPIRPLHEDYVPAGGWPTVTIGVNSIVINKVETTGYPPPVLDDGAAEPDATLNATANDNVDEDGPGVVTDSSSATPDTTLTASATDAPDDDSPAVVTDSAIVGGVLGMSGDVISISASESVSPIDVADNPSAE